MSGRGKEKSRCSAARDRGVAVSRRTGLVKTMYLQTEEDPLLFSEGCAYYNYYNAVEAVLCLLCCVLFLSSGCPHEMRRKCVNSGRRNIAAKKCEKKIAENVN